MMNKDSDNENTNQCDNSITADDIVRLLKHVKKDDVAKWTQRFENAYQRACHYYQVKKIDKALSLFNDLAVLMPADKRIIFAVAACYQRQKNYPQAISSYLAAAKLDHADPHPWLQCAECYVALEDGAAAQSMLDIVAKIHASTAAKGSSSDSKAILQHMRRITNAIAQIKHTPPRG